MQVLSIKYLPLAKFSDEVFVGLYAVVMGAVNTFKHDTIRRLYLLAWSFTADMEINNGTRHYHSTL